MEEVVISGGKRTRTADILLAKQALYQLSYTPNNKLHKNVASLFNKVCI